MDSNLLAEGAQKVKANNKYSAKLSYKRMKDLELSKQADEYLKERNIFLPIYFLLSFKFVIR